MGVLGSLGSESLWAQQELSLISTYASKLDPFEAHQIGQADAAFAQNKYSEARAAYDSFLLEFPQSSAVAYAVYRKGRSLYLENKRFEAIKVYQEVLDYFPSDIPYATAALFYIGDAEWANGDKPKALAAWNKLVDDKDYRQQSLAAFALNRLASVSEGEQAVKYYRMVAKEFRKSNPQAAKEAMLRVIDYHVSRQNEPPLREFYVETSGFGDAPVELSAGDVMQADGNYWSFLVQVVRRLGGFSDAQLSQRKTYYKYWGDQMAGINPGWDGLQIERIQFQLEADRDIEKWKKELDDLFARQPLNDGRVRHWLTLYANHKDKQAEYFSKLNGKGLTPAESLHLLATILRDFKNPEMAKSAVGKIPLSTYTDEQKISIAMNQEIWGRNTEVSKAILATMQNVHWGKSELLAIYDATNQPEPALELVDELVKVECLASKTYFFKGRSLFRTGKYEEAIAALRQSQLQPESNFLIADSMVRLGQIDKAVAQLREIENFFKPHSSDAAWRVGLVYRDAGRGEEHVAALRGIMKKYPDSQQSNAAHLELEKMGIRIGGGLDAKG